LDPSSAETRLSDRSPARVDEATRRADEATRLADDVTRLARPDSRGAAPPKATSSSSGWLSSSGSIDHGRFAPGSLLDGRYRMIGLLGRGGMGEVYRADDLRLGQPVALKFLPENLQRDPVRLAQLHNEVRTARQVSHPNVCRVYDAGEAEGHLYLTMEYVDGEDLATSLRRIGRFPEDKGLAIARQLCAGLASAHERGVLHRDLKPANVMLDGAGNVRIMDFSLATAGDVETVRAGTPVYMAPEQLQGREVTARSDIYALGLVLYELFTGRRAYTANSIADLVAQHESGAIVPPTEIVKTLDPAIERAILRCLMPDPAARPSSALTVSAALPGGDPLAAALAAGETPSPEMVAAAGGETAALSSGRAVALVVTALVLLGLNAALADRTLIMARVPFEKPRVVLIDRAAELRRTFGYTTPVLDSASGYYYEDSYLADARRRGAGADGWTELSRGRPSAVVFWSRFSPSLLVPYDETAEVSTGEPPMLTPGMVRLDLDPAGRLVLFRAVPSQSDPPLGASVNWDLLFQAARLDPSSFTEIEPAVLPTTYADERRAWKGTIADVPGMSFTIEASGFRGRPTSFRVATSREGGDGGNTPGTSPVVRAIGVLIVGALPIAAAFLARRNVRLGRGDSRGALRAAGLAFAFAVCRYVVAPAHVNGLEEVDRMFGTLGNALFWCAVLYVMYLALEPYVRRTWPRVLITWSRFIAWDVRDPLVGRDLILGSVAALFITLTGPAQVMLPALFGQPWAPPNHTKLAAILGGREVVVALLAAPTNALMNSMFVMLILALIRQGVKGLAGRLGPSLSRIAGSDWVTAAVSALLFLIIVKRNNLDPVSPQLDIAVNLVILFALIVVALRLGLFAVAVTFFVLELAGDMPLTLDASKAYAGPVFLVMALVFGLGVIGARWAAGRGLRASR
jgi:serine/threonine-protein kinase